MEIIPIRFREKWNKYEISILVLASLLLQILLIAFSLFRDRRANKLISLLLWSSYLGADFVATLALGNLLNQQNQSLEENSTGDLAAFWGPFLLLHLGGPDTITSYSLEDNQLWLRHLLGLILQVFTAVFIFLESLPSPHLWQAAIVVFAAGILKYAERTCSLRSASMDQLRASMLTEPDHWAVRFNEEFRFPKEGEFEEDEVIFLAHSFIQTFKRLIVWQRASRRWLGIPSEEWIGSQTFFLRLSSKQAFHVVETELSLLHDMLHTKAVHVHNGMGRTMRFLSLSMASLALVLFYRANKGDFGSREIRITYILLFAALAIEVNAIVLLVFSDWNIVSLQQIDKLSHPWIARIKDIVRGKKLARLIVNIRRLVLGELATRRWSNSMGQYNLISLCLRDYKWARLERFVRYLGLKHGVYIWLKNMWEVWLRETWDGCFHEKLTVTDDLKDLIFVELKKKVEREKLETAYKRFRSFRGEWVLRDKGYTELDWSVKKEFDESILLWHIATHLCYMEDQRKSEQDARKEENKNIPTSRTRISQAMRMILSRFAESIRMIWSVAEPQKDVEENQPPAMPRDVKAKSTHVHLEISRNISEYMMFLVVFKPSMLPAGIGKLQFQDTCAETMKFFNYKDTDINEAVATNVKAKSLKLAEEEGASARKADSAGWKDTLRAIGKRKEPNLISRKEMKKEKEKAACDMLMRVETSIGPIQVKGDRSKSGLFDACKLVKNIKDTFEDRQGKKWEVISAVWVEMLCYAALNCVTHAHAKQLSQGGELLTHACLLMTHFGIAKRQKISGR